MWQKERRFAPVSVQARAESQAIAWKHLAVHIPRVPFFRVAAGSGREREYRNGVHQ